jgi:hypothetical protein
MVCETRSNADSDIEPGESISDETLWQEIFSLREQLKIAAFIVKSYHNDFDEHEFLASLGHMDFKEWIDSWNDFKQTLDTEDDPKQ